MANQPFNIDKTYDLIHEILQPYRVDYPHYRVPKDVYETIVELYESSGLMPETASSGKPLMVAVYDPIDKLPVVK